MRYFSPLLNMLMAPDEPAGGAAVATPPAPASGAAKRVPYRIDFPFTKQAPANPQTGDLELTGYANTWVMDRDFEVVAQTAFDRSLPAYLEKNPILLWQHNPAWPIGQVLDAHTDDRGLWVRAVVRRALCLGDGVEDELATAYHSIAAGVVKTFSIGGWFEREITGQVLVICDVELWEISCVSIPSNPDSLYEAAMKAKQGEQPRARLSDVAMSQMAQLLGMERISDPQLLMLDADGRARRYHQLAAVYQAAGCAPPAADAWHQVEARDTPDTDPRELLADVTGLLAQVRGADKNLALAVNGQVKRGRVLSAANEGKLRDAVGLHEQGMGKVAEVLAAVEAQADEEEGEGAGGWPYGTHSRAAAADGKAPSPEDYAAAMAAIAGQVEAAEAALAEVGLYDTDEEPARPRPGDTVNIDGNEPDAEAYVACRDQVGAAIEAIEEQLEALGWEDPDRDEDVGDTPEGDDTEDAGCALEGAQAGLEVVEAALESVGVPDPDEDDEDAAEDAGEPPTPAEYAQAVTIIGYAVEAVEELLEMIGWVDPDAGEDASEPAQQAAARLRNLKRALSTPSLPIAARDRAWDAAAARRRVKDWAGDSTSKYARAFLWQDDGAPADKLTSYRFIVCDVIDGGLQYVPRGVFAAANVLSGGRGGSNIGDAGVAALKRSVERLYSRMRSKFNDDSITVPWAD